VKSSSGTRLEHHIQSLDVFLCSIVTTSSPSRYSPLQPQNMMSQEPRFKTKMLSSVTHNSNGFAKPREPCSHSFRPRLQSLPVSLFTHSVKSDPYFRRPSHDFASLLHTQFWQDHNEMATVTSNTMKTQGLTPPDTPPALSMKAKKQIPATPPSERRSARTPKPTGK